MYLSDRRLRLPGPMDTLAGDSGAMAGLSPRSLSTQKLGLVRELGLRLAIGGGVQYFSRLGKGRWYCYGTQRK